MRKTPFVLAALLAVAGICVMLWPVVTGYRLQANTDEAVQNFLEERKPEQQYPELLAALREYNQRIYAEKQCNRQLLNLFILLNHRIVGGQQAVVKPLDHRHRQDHKAIFVGLERPAKHIRHIPDHRGLFLYIYAHGAAFLIDHWSLLQFWV